MRHIHGRIFGDYFRPNEQIICTLLLSLGPPERGSDYLAKFIGMRKQLGIPDTFTLADWHTVYYTYKKAMDIAQSISGDVTQQLIDHIEKGKAVPRNKLPPDDEEKT